MVCGLISLVDIGSVKDELFCNLVDADGYYFTHFLQDKSKKPHMEVLN